MVYLSRSAYFALALTGSVLAAEQTLPEKPTQPANPAAVSAQPESPAQAVQAARPPPPQPEPRSASEAPHHGFGHKLLFYLPNRIFDTLDIVRARVRLGPGMALGLRITKATDVFMGAYKTFYLGLPGPRLAPRPPWPGGLESRSGLAASMADKTVSDPDSGPNYASTEIGAGVQAVLAGAEVGVDPGEVFDLVFGLLFIDFREDDL